VVCVLAITDDFDKAVIQGKGDLSTMPPYFAERCQVGLEDRRYNPQLGINAIQTAGILLDRVRTDEAGELNEKLRALYRAAYDWDPPQSTSTGRLSSTTVRETIKLWIATWDLKRLLPGVDADVETEKFKDDFENQDIEGPSEKSNDEGLIEEIMKLI
jgi:hypothetical protein